MDHMIKEKFIVTDGEKVTDEIYRVTGLDIEIDQIIENISSEESNIYFFDKDLSEKPENEKDVILAWIDTGIKVNGNEPLMISLLKRSDYFSGYYVGTPSYLVNGMCRKTLYSEKKLRSNLLKFCHRYREEHAERICKVETEVKDRSEGYCEKTIFIKNEEVLSNVTEAIYGRLLFPNWKSMKGLDRYIKIIGARITQLVDAGRTEYFVSNKTKSAIVKSVSCPTADIIGIFELNIALAVISSLNAHKSSILPPPRPTISVSTSFVALKYSIALTTLSAAPTPCTCAGYITISAIG